MMMRFTSYTARIPSDRVGDKLEENIFKNFQTVIIRRNKIYSYNI